MVEIDKKMAKATLQWLEILLDECHSLSEEDKAAVQTLINFWRLNCSFASE